LGTQIVVENNTEPTVREYRRGNTNGQSRENGNIGHTRLRKTKQKHAQYVLDNSICKEAQIT
jgi:hypothetical protein